MRLYVLMVVCLCSLSAVAPSDSNSFEGIITYAVKVDVIMETPLRQHLEQIYGDTVVEYVSRDGSYRKDYINAGEKGYDFTLYYHRGNMLYTKKNDRDSVTSASASENNLVLNSIKQGDTLTILGQKCKSIIVECIEPRVKQKVLTTYYYSGTPAQDPLLYKDYKDLFYNVVMKETKSHHLKYVLDFSSYVITFTAVHMEEKKLDKSIFELQGTNRKKK